MSGREIYESKPRDRTWHDLIDEERATWNLGASLPPVDGALNVTLYDDNVKTR